VVSHMKNVSCHVKYCSCVIVIFSMCGRNIIMRHDKMYHDVLDV